MAGLRARAVTADCQQGFRSIWHLQTNLNRCHKLNGLRPLSRLRLYIVVIDSTISIARLLPKDRSTRWAIHSIHRSC